MSWDSRTAKASWLLAAHYLGDLILQSDWMAQEKQRSHSVLARHAAVYGAAFLAMGFGWWTALFVAVPHFLIDVAKARWGIHRSLLLDQLLHAVVILLAFQWSNRQGEHTAIGERLGTDGRR